MNGYSTEQHDLAAEKLWRDIESLPDDPIGKARALAAFGRKMCGVDEPPTTEWHIVGGMVVLPDGTKHRMADTCDSTCRVCRPEQQEPLLILGPGGEYRREIHEEDIDGAPKL